MAACPSALLHSLFWSSHLPDPPPHRSFTVAAFIFLHYRAKQRLASLSIFVYQHLKCTQLALSLEQSSKVPVPADTSPEDFHACWPKQ